MKKSLVAQVRELQHMSVGKLREKYYELFGEEAISRNKAYYVRRISYRLQERVHGTLSDRAKARARELADEAHLRVRVSDRAYQAATGQKPPKAVVRDPRLPPPGTTLKRVYKGATYEVTVLDKGCIYNDQTYSSLSAAASAITGTQWNGYRFFVQALRKYQPKPADQ